MARCELCGNDYEKAFTVEIAGETHTFDCFDCAVHSLAPQCRYCGCRVTGRGVERNETIYCCPQCATSGSGGKLLERA